VRARARDRSPEPPAILTIGHSTRPIDEFIALLRENGVARVADVRTVPRSRHNPQFEKSSLARSLQNAGIDYVHLPALGGLRHPRRNSANTGWRNASFRGYADHMQTPEFAEAIGALIRLAEPGTLAVMCAEAVPWRCHRSLIGDALLARGIAVEEVLGPGQRRSHELTRFAKVSGTTITYPGGAANPQSLPLGSGAE
jgi:uncharacterized protein (DUF488 family)